MVSGRWKLPERCGWNYFREPDNQLRSNRWRMQPRLSFPIQEPQQKSTPQDKFQRLRKSSSE